MRPERGPARIGRRDPVDGILRDGHQKGCAQNERHADPQHAAVKECPDAFAREARPDEKPGNKEKERHQEHVESAQ